MRLTTEQVAVVTGGGRGIGAAAAGALAGHGMAVIIADLEAAAAQEAAAQVQSSGGTALDLQLDVTDGPGVQAMAEEVLDRWGRIDVLVNNAGVLSTAPFLDINLDEYRRLMQVNVEGTWLCCRAVIPAMIRQGGGRIINMASVAGERGGGIFGTSAYATSKGAVIALTKALAREFAAAGVLVNAVCPAVTDTEMVRERLRTAAGAERLRAITPLGRPATVDEVAAVVAFLASSQASYITGHAYHVDGGAAI
jgi:NAD(P)-dependent dehydrogenase (short-subunit alcohol dehydrogenase family)